MGIVYNTQNISKVVILNRNTRSGHLARQEREVCYFFLCALGGEMMNRQESKLSNTILKKP